MIDEAEDGDTIDLDGTCYYGNGKTIKINKPLTINGNGATLDATKLSRILLIESQYVTINNVNFINGYLMDDHGKGSAILCDAYYSEDIDDYVYSLYCSINNCSFANCSAESYGFSGDIFAVVLYADDIVMTDCSFVDNTWGTVLWDGNNGVMKNCRFVNNTAFYGGAIHWGGSNGTVYGCNFTDNRVITYLESFQGGAAIYVQTDGDLIIDSCLFINNTVDTSYTDDECDGGAIYCYDANSLSILNCNFVSNSVINDYGRGGAIYLRTPYDSNVNYSIINCTFDKNSAKYISSIKAFSGCNIINNTFNNNPYYETIPTIVDGVPASTLLANGNKFNFIKVSAVITPVSLSTTYRSEKTFNVKVTDDAGNALSNVKLALKIYTGNKYTTYYVTTGSNGYAKFTLASNLAIGTHKVVVSSANRNAIAADKTSSIVVKKATTTVVAPTVTNKYKKSAYFKVGIRNKASGKLVTGLTLKVKVYTGKKYKVYTIKTNANGIALLNTKLLSKGTHKVVITSSNNYYTVSKTSYIKIK